MGYLSWSGQRWGWEMAKGQRLNPSIGNHKASLFGWNVMSRAFILADLVTGSCFSNLQNWHDMSLCHLFSYISQSGFFCEITINHKHAIRRGNLKKEKKKELQKNPLFFLVDTSRSLVSTERARLLVLSVVRSSCCCVLFVQDVGKENAEWLLFLWAPPENEMPVSPGHSREPNSK